ncbi:MAG: Hsp70 family protein [Polyangiaceae bacterium]|nr:Hsp70 family protein [Polyangiaceae bacterium]
MAVVGIDFGTAALRALSAPATGAEPPRSSPEEPAVLPATLALARRGDWELSEPGAPGASPGVKRLLGRTPSDPLVRRVLARVDAAGVERGGALWVKGADGAAADVAGGVALLLREAARRAAGLGPHQVVVTVPGWYGLAEREALRGAVRAAGLELLALVPDVAALAFGRARGDARLALVLDAGAGGYGAGLVRASEGLLELVGSTGDAELGGDDFDVELATAALEGCELPLRPALWRAVEGAKRELAERDQASHSLARSDGTRVRVVVDRWQMDLLAGRLAAAVSASLGELWTRCGRPALDSALVTGGLGVLEAVLRAAREALGRGLEPAKEHATVRGATALARAIASGRAPQLGLGFAGDPTATATERKGAAEVGRPARQRRLTEPHREGVRARALPESERAAPPESAPVVDFTRSDRARPESGGPPPVAVPVRFEHTLAPLGTPREPPAREAAARSPSPPPRDSQPGAAAASPGSAPPRDSRPGSAPSQATPGLPPRDARPRSISPDDSRPGPGAPPRDGQYSATTTRSARPAGGGPARRQAPTPTRGPVLPEPPAAGRHAGRVVEVPLARADERAADDPREERPPRGPTADSSTLPRRGSMTDPLATLPRRGAATAPSSSLPRRGATTEPTSPPRRGAATSPGALRSVVETQAPPRRGAATSPAVPHARGGGQTDVAGAPRRGAATDAGAMSRHDAPLGRPRGAVPEPAPRREAVTPSRPSPTPVEGAPRGELFAPRTAVELIAVARLPQLSLPVLLGRLTAQATVVTLQDGRHDLAFEVRDGAAWLDRDEHGRLLELGARSRLDYRLDARTPTARLVRQPYPLLRVAAEILLGYGRAWSAEELAEALGDRMVLAPTLRTDRASRLSRVLDGRSEAFAQTTLDGTQSARAIAEHAPLGRHATLQLLCLLAAFDLVEWRPVRRQSRTGQPGGSPVPGR